MEHLHPAYFALVMATGIVSVACHLLGLGPAALALVPVNVVSYAILVALNLLRAVRFPGRVLQDLVDHQRGVGYFTAVAATSVLGVQLVVVLGQYAVATALWGLAIVLWAVLTYGVFAAFTVKQLKPSLAEGISGGWLVATGGGILKLGLEGEVLADWQAASPRGWTRVTPAKNGESFFFNNFLEGLIERRRLSDGAVIAAHDIARKCALCGVAEI